jgi:hypothetical protein
LIIIDEVHLAAKMGQTIQKSFKAANFFKGKDLDADFLYENDIKIVEYSATPNGTLYDHNKWKEEGMGERVFAKNEEGYISPQKLFESGRVFESQNMISANEEECLTINKRAFESFTREARKFETPRWHIMRLQKGSSETELSGEDLALRNEIRKAFRGQVDFKFYTQRTRQEFNLNEELKNPPRRHTVILIKEMLRCAKTLEKKHIGVLYDRPSARPSDSVGIQGLLGRNCGYDTNEDSVVFTNIKSIHRYKEAWDRSFHNSVKWESDTTRVKKDRSGLEQTESTGTFNDPSTRDSVDKSDVLLFDDIAEVEGFAMANKRSFLWRNPNDQGFQTRKGRVWSVDDAQTHLARHGQRGDPAGLGLYVPCYWDVRDPGSMVFAVPIDRNYKVKTKEQYKAKTKEQWMEEYRKWQESARRPKDI